MYGQDEWLSPARVQKPAYNPAPVIFRRGGPQGFHRVVGHFISILTGAVNGVT